MVREKVTKKDIAQRAKENEHLKQIHAFLIIGKRYQRIVFYTADNDVGKMSNKVFKDQIIPAIVDELNAQGLFLVIDKDSAHDSSITVAEMKKQNLKFLILPANSPDLSIFETMARPIKRFFHAEYTGTERAAKKRLSKIFYEEMSQKTIDRAYKSYCARFHDVRRANG